MPLIQLIAQKNVSPILAKPVIDERIELMSIVFRLAGCEEYTSDAYKFYATQIEAHFATYKNHELIEYTKKIRQTNNIGYDAVMSMAIHISAAPNFKPLVPFTSQVPDNRWGKKTADKFLKLLRKFYIDAKCVNFFKNNASLYQDAMLKFLPVYEALDLNWYKSFYGKEPNEKFVIIIGLGNGNGNYGPNLIYPQGNREVYAIMGTWSTDSLGKVNFPFDKYFPILLHEFNHSFVNYLTEKHKIDFQNSGEIIFSAVKNEMNYQAYGDWTTMLSEALVRAAVIQYMIDHNFDKVKINEETEIQLNRGFLWIEELVAELGNYSKQRGKYPTLEAYMPVIIKAYQVYAQNINEYVRRFDEKRPKIIS
ncbi:MAG: DUF4932 domain-containing protein, partial [Bacteroidia bacterium]